MNQNGQSSPGTLSSRLFLTVLELEGYFQQKDISKYANMQYRNAFCTVNAVRMRNC
jgi:hypothetical protein